MFKNLFFNYYLLAIILIFFYLFPYFFLGSDGNWTVWDNLDNEFVHYKILINSGKLFSSNTTIVEQPMGGIPRGSFRSEYDAFVLLYKLFGEKWSYIINRTLLSVVGFVGMNVFLKHHIIKKNNDEIIRVFVSLFFSILPFWPWAGISVAGMPLAMHAILNIRNKNFTWLNWFIIILYTYYSSLVHCGIFFLIFLAVIFIHDFIFKKKLSPILFALILMTLLYVIFNYRLFYDFILPSEYISHRVEQISYSRTDLETAIKSAASIFLNGSAHAKSLHRYFILPTIVLGACYIFFITKNRNIILFWQIIFTLFLISFFRGFQNFHLIYKFVIPIKELVPMQIDRFSFLNPFFWMVAFAIVLSNLKRIFFFKKLMFLIFALQIVYSFKNHEIYLNRNKPSQSQFFAHEQFEDIKKYINKPLNTFRLASVGMHPSVALFNGFYTLDGYWANYPLSYKYKFRNIIARELDKDENLKKYYDNWGNRVYLFNSITLRNMEIYSGNTIELNNIEFDWKLFYNLGGRYILSAVKINTQKIPELIFEKKFDNKNSVWEVYLYSVKPV